MKTNLLAQLMNNMTTTSWDSSTGSSWYYYVNTGDYKLENWGDNVRLTILTAGLTKEDIEASLEDTRILVTSSKPGWNGALYVDLDLRNYNIDMKDPTVEMANGVLTIDFPRIEKRKLEIR